MKYSILFERCLSASYIHVENGADYAIRRLGDTLYVFLESSDGITDWKNNLNFPARAYQRGDTVWYAHRGFLKVWKTLETYLKEDIMAEDLRKIVTVGYSHGAALAVFCHEYIWYHRPDLRGAVEGFGFGAPRVFWGKLTDGLANRWEGFTVIRNRDDVVTFLPPSFLGYRHVGAMLEIGEKGKYSDIDAHRAENILRELKIYEQIPEK